MRESTLEADNSTVTTLDRVGGRGVSGEQGPRGAQRRGDANMRESPLEADDSTVTTLDRVGDRGASE